MSLTSARHVSPKIEEIELNTDYAISLNPEGVIGTSQTVAQFMIKIGKELREMMIDTELRLYPEFSPLGRFHFHGYLRTKSYLGYIRTIQKLCVGYAFCIKPIENKYIGDKDDELPQTWYDYCTKQSFYLEEEVGSDLYPMVVHKPQDQVNAPDRVFTGKSILDYIDGSGEEALKKQLLAEKREKEAMAEHYKKKFRNYPFC